MFNWSLLLCLKLNLERVRRAGMGSGTSRGTKVAPARVTEVSVSKTASGVASVKQDARPFIHARNRAEPQRCHSDGHDSDSSAQDDDTFAADRAQRESKRPPEKVKCRTYGLCHFSREDAEDDFGSAPRLSASDGAEEPRGSRGGSTVVNNRSDDAFTHFKQHTSDRPRLNKTSTHGFMPRGTLLEAVPTSDKQSCHSASLTMPVILYDGSEEELMDTIEREFS